MSYVLEKLNDLDKVHEVIFTPCAFKNQMNGDNQDYKLKEYPIGYSRHMGMGHNLYVLVKNDKHIDKIQEVCNQRINPKFMAQQLNGLMSVRIIMVDYEMGSMCVFCSE